MHGTRETCGSLLAGFDVHPRVAMQIAAQQDRRHDGDLHQVPSAATREAPRTLGQWLDR